MNGIEVLLVDRTPELLDAARRLIGDNLDYMRELGEITPEQIGSALSRISLTTDIKGAAAAADFVLEAVSENVDLKKTIFARLDECARPFVPLATNTSSFDISDLAAATMHPERVIGAHWFHPPQITPAVEVIPGERTSRETIDITMAFMKRVGKIPTHCKSAPGFVANRIQYAMVAEALALVEEGLATPEEIDRIVKTSFGFRLGAYGPFEICDQAGIDTYYAVFQYLYGKLKREQFRPPELLKKLVEKGRFGLKARGGFYDYKEGAVEAVKRQRDQRLYRRLRLVREEIGRGPGE
jgi:3-hydroxybutyryl-CoA dehydrogenase